MLGGVTAAEIVVEKSTVQFSQRPLAPLAGKGVLKASFGQINWAVALMPDLVPQMPPPPPLLGPKLGLAQCDHSDTFEPLPCMFEIVQFGKFSSLYFTVVKQWVVSRNGTKTKLSTRG